MRAGITNVSSTPLDERLDPPTSATTLFARLWALLSSRFGLLAILPLSSGHRRRRAVVVGALRADPSSSGPPPPPALLGGRPARRAGPLRRIGPAAVALRSVTLRAGHAEHLLRQFSHQAPDPLDTCRRGAGAYHGIKIVKRVSEE